MVDGKLGGGAHVACALDGLTRNAGNHAVSMPAVAADMNARRPMPASGASARCLSEVFPADALAVSRSVTASLPAFHMIIPPDQNLQETGLAAAVAAKARRRKPGLASDRHRLGLSRSLARGRRFSYITVHPGYGRKSSGARTCSTFSSIKRETNALFIIF